MRLHALLAAASVVTLLTLAGNNSVHAEEAKSQTNNTQATTQQAQPAAAPAPVVVTVQAGDSLAKIAAAHGTTYVRLFDANPQVQNPNIIHPGWQIRIPAPTEQLASRAVAVAQPVVQQPRAAATQAQPRAVTQKRTTAARPAAQPQAVAQTADAGVWDRLAQCESGGNWSINTGNGYYGGLQFSAGSWRGVGGSGTANQASKAEQIARAEALKARQGWGAWPACSAKLGLR